MSLTYALTCQLDIFLLIRYAADLEKSIVSIERIREYQKTPIEAALETDNDPKEGTWPDHGVIEFKDYQTR